jgi:heme iron utilization protein
MTEQRLPEPPAAAFDHTGMIRKLLAAATHGAMGTVTPDGGPFTSLVQIAKDDDLAPVIITSHLSGHTGHLEKDPRVSLLITDIGKGDPLAHPRLTIMGRALAARPGEPEYDRLRPLYLKQQPKAQLYVDLPGFWFWRIEPVSVALNGGFGKAWTGPWVEAAG